ncbi:multimodular transpeptidase-transglycosylase [Bacillus sp. JCM 19046]|nr:multimodular transpeptidase-transglycosylase [Bacillus sp. JCM 19046]
MMRDVIYGGGNASRVQGMLNFRSDWAAKTGTSQRQRDSWFIAANPDVSFGVWYGYSGPDLISLPSEVNGVGLSARTQTIWANLANAAHSVNPSLMTAEGQRFVRPSGLSERRVCGLTGGSSNRFCEAENLVTTDLYANDMLSKIDGLAPFQAEFKRTMDQLLEDLRNQEAEERRRQEEAEEQQQEDTTDEEEPEQQEPDQQEDDSSTEEDEESTEDEEAVVEDQQEENEEDSEADSEEDEEE